MEIQQRLGKNVAFTRALDEAFSLANLVEVAVRNARNRADSIDQAILTKAFRGELVPQDPSDEPASVLLQRMKSTTKQQGLFRTKLAN